MSPTPRQMRGDRFFNKTAFSAVPFYYINFLLEKNPRAIYDLGCGWNIFKKYIPEVIGVGAETEKEFADLHDFVDDEYVSGHIDYFESVFSINALHFCPLSKFSKIIQDFHSMIKPGGRGFLALIFQRMIDRDPVFQNVSHNNIETYCRNELTKLTNIKFLVVDIRIDPIEEPMDGNIRLVMEK